MTKRTKRKVVLKAKWEMPWTGYARLRWGGGLNILGVTPTCATGKRLFRAFGTRRRKLKITIEEV